MFVFSVILLQTRKASVLNRGADKPLARPRRKQALKHVKDARGFKKTSRRELSSRFFPAEQSSEGNLRYSGRNNSLFLSWSG